MVIVWISWRVGWGLYEKFVGDVALEAGKGDNGGVNLGRGVR